ncbi:MAG TPA: RIP metalloprotease RseP [Thermomicrobiales bacterium]|nr:RIP metalloprotease RseP [Thermomicrobiales bacterium]
MVDVPGKAMEAGTHVSEGLLNGLYIIPILAVLILVHEIGHFVAARMIGVKVEEFGIGIPPRIKGWRRNGVLWSLNWIPFGGFVKVLGEDGKASDPESINSKSPAKRAFFLVAGSAMNFLLAFLLMILVVGFQGVSHSNVYIASVVPGSPAEEASWEPGDRIVEVAGVPVESSTDVGQRAREFSGIPMSVVVERDGALVETSVVPRINPPAGEGPTGVGITDAPISDASVSAVSEGSPAANAGLQPGDQLLAVGPERVEDPYALQFALNAASGSTVPIEIERGGELETVSLAVPVLDAQGDLLGQVGMDLAIEPRFDRVPLASVIPVGVAQAWERSGQMLSGIRDLVTGRAPLDQIAGPLGMGQITSEIVSASPLPLWVTLAQLAILLSLNLAVLNLLPLPALDGGRLLFVIVEVLRGGKKLAPEREGIVHVAGLILLLGFMVIVLVLDALRIYEGRSFLP